MDSSLNDPLKQMSLPREMYGIPVVYGREPNNNATRYIHVTTRNMSRFDLGETPEAVDAMSAVVSVHNRENPYNTPLPRRVRLTKYGSTTTPRRLARPLLIVAIMRSARQVRRK